jgi:L-histidine N-alpha-methyltransferase
MELDVVAETDEGLYSDRSMTLASPTLSERLTLRRALAGGAASRVANTFGDDVRQGLSARPKALLPKYFYDELGSHLFEAITALPEYYVTRAEEEILLVHSGAIAAAMTAGPALSGAGSPVRLLELGSGSARKTRHLIEALLGRQGELEYLPIDVSESALLDSGLRWLAAYPGLRVTALLGEYQDALRDLRSERRQEARTLALFLGSSLGNLDAAEREALLHELRASLRPGDGFLLGVDLKKDEATLLRAYDDPLKVTAAFNLNLLARINRELGGEFDLAAFRHLARYNGEAGRIEMHLESLSDQVVPIRKLGLEVELAAGETIHTESSYKFDRGQVEALAAATGFEIRQAWTDVQGRFASNLLIAK